MAVHLVRVMVIYLAGKMGYLLAVRKAVRLVLVWEVDLDESSDIQLV